MKIKIDNFNLEQIALSGQCFRWKKIDDNTYIVPAYGHAVKIVSSGNNFDFSCSEEDWNNIWKEYFDISRDYADIERRILSGKDEHLKNAFAYGSGIRILKQNLWEMIFSFMVSQNNNIKRISKTIELVCEYCGCKVAEYNNSDFKIYRFPDAEEIPLEIFDDSSFGFGYRAEYLKEICEYVCANPDWTSRLMSMSYDEAFASLIERKGIGAKVANCICLFGLSHVNAFPIDTHVKKLLAKHYPNGIDLSNFKNDAGIIQQYLFYYDLNE